MSARHLNAVVAALTLVVACDRGTRSPASDTSAAKRPASTPTIVAVGSDTVGCGAIAKTQFGEPEQLINEWVHRDSLGYFLRSDERLFELMACPGHLGGGDEIVVATEPRVERLPSIGDSAVFVITYRRYGRVHSDSTGNHETFVPEPGLDSVSTRVVRTPWGWRFPFDVANPHLSPRMALEKVEATWNPEARDSLAALAERLPHS